jgi:act minimal PKS acyl carrier protein
MSNALRFDDLRSILVDAAGELEDVDLDSGTIDSDLYDLGYDSLALLEVAARLQQQFGVKISDEEVTELRTFRLILDRVNGAATAAAAN